ncbi:uncharacterized protein LOC125038543 isoform X2 [Penaeus chinensis]|uniref:uncharacterized protein LOC125038543 isoform X2 n=1 Tax=Penaeus chinensis TaxID=139456 RepID=UPI001FB713EE|nr:uncharacterized protein LOC125038543 isoform X2 [Penaeus chinensis]
MILSSTSHRGMRAHMCDVALLQLRLPRRIDEYASEGHRSDCGGSDSEMDYVSLKDTSPDSDELLYAADKGPWQRKAPGTNRFVWQKQDDFPRHWWFKGCPGVKVPNLNATSSSADVYRCIVTDEFMDVIVRGTNWYCQCYPKEFGF